MNGELTGQRRYMRVKPFSLSLPQIVMAVEVEYSEYNMDRNVWENKWRFATPEDLGLE